MPADDEDRPIPETEEAMEEEIAVLQDAVETIQAQLGDQKRRHPKDRDMSPYDYAKWRTSATWALAKKKARLRLLKNSIKKVRVKSEQDILKRMRTRVGSDDLLLDIKDLIEHLASECDYDLTPEEDILRRLVKNTSNRVKSERGIRRDK